MSTECRCGAKMEHDLSVEVTTHIPSSAFPYITNHISGSPIEVQSLAHLRQLEKQYNVRNRDDAEFIEERWDGFDMRSGEHRYGGGRGGGGGHSTRWI